MRPKNYGGGIVRFGSLLASVTLVHATSVCAQNIAITNLTVPGAAAISVSGLNQTGQVAGVYTLPGGAKKTFLWSPTAVWDVGTLGGNDTEASALNNAGDVVGLSATSVAGQTHGFLFSGGAISDLGPAGSPFSSAVGINNVGQVTGYFVNGPLQHGFLWSGGVLTDLGTLGGMQSFPAAINNAGQVAGQSSGPGEMYQHAFLYSGGMMNDLGALGGTYSLATSLNTAGHVTGMASIAGDVELHAFLYNGATMMDLGTLGGSFSIGYVVNDSDHVVGDSLVMADAENHAFLHSAGVMHDLGTLGGGFSTPLALNSLDQVVGISANGAGADRAFLWKNGAMIDLNTLLPAGSGWDLDAAYYINDHGQIVGTGTYLGQPSWFLMSMDVQINHPPVAEAGPDQTIQCAGFSTAVELVGTASSDPDGDSLTYEWRQGQFVVGTSATVTVAVALGSTTFTLRVTDLHGATSEDTVVVTFVDHQPPVVRCAPPATMAADGSGQAVVPNFLFSSVASDACTPDVLVTKTQNPPAGTVVGQGTTVVTVTATDTSGNVGSCTTSFTVVDTTPPTVQCPAGVTSSAGADGLGVVPNFLPQVVASDNGTPAQSLALSQNPAAGTHVGLGATTVTISVTDAAGNTSSCSTSFTVVDSTPPSVQCPAGVTSSAGADGQGVVPNFVAGLVCSDNCTPAQSLSVSQNPVAGTHVGLGATVVTLSVTDAAGNTSSCSTSINVVDTTPPSVQCPAPASASAGPDGQGAVPNFLSGLVCSDNCTSAGSLVVSQSPSAGTRVGPGTVTVVISVTDAAGNTTSCNTSFTVTAGDTTPPVIQCPAGVTAVAGNAGLANVPNFMNNLVASDNVTPAQSLVISQTPRPGSRVGVGTTVVVVSVTDAAGNAATCTTSVTVVDTTAPKISNLSATPDKLTPLNHQMVPVTLTATVQDNCDPMPTCRIVSVTSNETSSNPGEPDWEITGAMTLRLRAEQNDNSTRRVYTITVQARDAAGNVTTDTVKVNTAKK